MMRVMTKRREQSSKENTVASLGQNTEAKTNSWDHEEDYEARLLLTFDASRVLQVKRWEVREGPFRGFNSPPGRF